MTFQVLLSERAQRDLDGFPDKIAQQILTDYARLGDDPVPDGKRIKKLQGFKESLCRLRAGDYRVVFKRSGTRIDIVRVPASQIFRRPTDQPCVIPKPDSHLFTSESRTELDQRAAVRR